MFDIGWTEMMMVAIVAILFVGPKELPGMLRVAGQTIKKLRGMAGDVQRQFDDALKEAELDGVKDSINEVRNLNPTKAIKDKLNPLKDDLDEVERDLNDGEPLVFDESRLPNAPKPVKVDVEAALARQKKLDETTAKKTVAKKPAAKKTTPRKPVAKTAPATKAAAKLAAKKAAPRKAAPGKAAPKKTAKKAAKAAS